MAKKYTKDHEWIEQAGDNWRVGITDFAQQELGDVVMVDFPEVGREVKAGEECMAIESVKAASDIYSPVSGAIVAINGALTDDPALVNSAAEGEGWLYEIAASDAGEMDGLMDAAAYQTFVEDSQ